MSKRRTSESHESRRKMNFFSRPSTSSTSSASLIGFYEGTGRDHRGRTFSEILQWGAGKLESSHDYIQTVFPLPEASGVNWDAPIIDRQVFDAFHSRNELRDRLRDSFKKMLWFYGFKLGVEHGEFKVSKGENYEENSKNWDNRFDHNHLRITRMIRCLRVLGLEHEARAFRKALEESTRRASSRSLEFWRRAAERDLNLRPDLETDDEEDNTIGPKFLREYEVQRKAREQAQQSNTDESQDQAGLQAAEETQKEQKENVKSAEDEQTDQVQDSAEQSEHHEVTAEDAKEESTS